MATPTPTPDKDAVSGRPRSRSRARDESPPPQPTTPLRPPSRSSLRSSHGHAHVASTSDNVYSNPLGGLEPAFAELSDGMADLEANFMHLQLMHESLSRFTECFASFLYGLNINAFCVDFPEAPVAESFRRALENPAFMQPVGQLQQQQEIDADQTFMTSDTSFVENPPVNSNKPVAAAAAAAATPSRASARGGRGTTGRGTRGAAGRGASTRGGAAASSSGGASSASSTRGRASGLPRGTSSRGRAGGYR